MFAKRLKELRVDGDLKQSELAKIIGVSSSTIGMYEQGRRFADQETLSKIAECFNVSTDYLLGRSDIKNMSNQMNYKEDGYSEKVKEAAELFSELSDIQKEMILNLIKEVSKNAK